MNDLTKRLNETAEQIKLYQRERAIFEATELIAQTMNAKGISNSSLAKMLGKTKGYVTQLLDGPNMTISTLSDVFGAMGKSIHFFVCPLSAIDPKPPEMTAPFAVEDARWKGQYPDESVWAVRAELPPELLCQDYCYGEPSLAS